MDMKRSKHLKLQFMNLKKIKSQFFNKKNQITIHKKKNCPIILDVKSI